MRKVDLFFGHCASVYRDLDAHVRFYEALNQAGLSMDGEDVRPSKILWFDGNIHAYIYAPLPRFCDGRAPIMHELTDRDSVILPPVSTAKFARESITSRS